MAEIFLDGSASSDPDSGDQIISYEWYRGTSLSGASLISTEPKFSFSAAEGNYVFKLKVTDSYASTSEASVAVEVKKREIPIMVISAPADGQVVTLGTAVNLAGTGTPALDATVPNEAYLCTMDNLYTPVAVGSNTSYAFSSSGQHVLKLRASDIYGMKGERTVTILVNTPPTAGIATTPTSANGIVTITAGSSVNFSTTAVDADGNALTYAWNFGGGAANTSSSNPGNITFANTGTYTVTLTVTDSYGAAATAQQTVQVNTPYIPMFTVNGRMYSNAGNVTSGNVSWNTANSACANLTEGGGGWRLPTKAELLADVGTWKNYLSGVTFLWGGDGVTTGKAWVVNHISSTMELDKGYSFSGLGYRCVK